MMPKRAWCLLGAAAFLAASLMAQKKYSGPRPPKPDVPFLLHATKLVETESATVKESQERDLTVYTVPGATSPARTPLPEPIFLFQADKINPDRLSLMRMDARGGNRVASVSPPGRRKRDSPRPIFLMVTPLAPGLFKIEVNEFIDNGEYCLAPEGSRQAFCFTTY